MSYLTPTIATDGVYMAPWVTAAVSFGLVLFTIMFFLPMLRRRQRRIRQRAIAQRRAQQAPAGICRRSGAERVAAVENWLVSKPALSHDEVCDFALGAADVKSNDEETSKDCSICFESFQPDDVVSWSPNPACCKQVFHHGCLKEWLLHQNGCPWCRETMLPVDGYSLPKTERKQIHDLLVAQQERSRPCFYCLEHGIVRPTNQRARGEVPPKILGDLEQRQTFLCCKAVLSESSLVHDDDISVSKREGDEEIGIGDTTHTIVSELSTEDSGSNLGTHDLNEETISTTQSDEQIDQLAPVEVEMGDDP